MQLTCDTKKLSDALAAATKIIKKENMLRFKAENDHITLETAEHPQYVSTTVEAKVIEGGEYIVNAQLLANLISKIEDDAISISSVKDKEGSDKLIQVIYRLDKEKPAKANLPIISDSTMLRTPVIIPEKSFSFSKSDFDVIIKKVIFASAKETDNNNKFACVQLQFRNGALCANATDTHIIAQKIIRCTNNDTCDVIVPCNTLNQLLSIKGNKDAMITILLQGNMIEFKINNISLISQVINMKYPPVNNVMPKKDELDIDITLDKKETISAIQRLNLFNQKEDPLILQFENGQLYLVTKTTSGALKENLECQNKKNTQSHRLGLNVNYILNILSSIEAEQVSLSWRSEKTQAILVKDEKDANVRYVVSPVRLSVTAA